MPLHATQSEKKSGPHATMRLLIVDDHPIVLFGLTALLSVQKDIDVVGSAGSGPDALIFLKQNPVDLILLDLRMPGVSGIETLQKIREVAPTARTIVLSSFECDEE